MEDDTSLEWKFPFILNLFYFDGFPYWAQNKDLAVD